MVNGACMQGRRLLKRAVRILLECILVTGCKELWLEIVIIHSFYSSPARRYTHWCVGAAPSTLHPQYAAPEDAVEDLLHRANAGT